MDHCAQCGFVDDELEVREIPGALRLLGADFRSRLETGIRDSGRERTLRPEPEVWSALEYCCHVRDVLLIQRERLYLALVEDDLRFASPHRDQRAILARYNDESIEDVSREVDLAASLLARGFARLDVAQWTRSFTRSDLPERVDPGNGTSWGGYGGTGMGRAPSSPRRRRLPARAAGARLRELELRKPPEVLGALPTWWSEVKPHWSIRLGTGRRRLIELNERYSGV